MIETHFFQADCSHIQDLRKGGAGLPVHHGGGGAGEEGDGRAHHRRGGVRHGRLHNNDEQQRVSQQHPCKALLLRVHDVRNTTGANNMYSKL